MISYLLVLLFLSNLIFAHGFTELLDKRMQDTDSLVCVGLDPDISKMPDEITKTDKSPEEKVFSFFEKVIGITGPHASCFKLQKAFFDEFSLGKDLLRNTVACIHQKYPGTPVIVDCKIGDVENTLSSYIKNLFDDIKADAITVNPYMGDEIFEPFIKDKNKTALVLIKTSNQGSKIVQEIELKTGKKIWEHMLNLTVERWNANRNLVPVLESTSPSTDYSALRKEIPQDMPILLVGVGAQGGDPKVMTQLLNKEKRGVFVNSSRGITYDPYKSDLSDPEWLKKVELATIAFKKMLNQLKEQ